MTRLLAALTGALLMGQAAAPSSTPSTKPTVPLADYFKIRRISGASFLFDESLIVYASDEGGRMDLWARPLRGGAARQLTHVKGAIESFEFSPRADLLVFAADLGGNELTRLYLTDSRGKAPEALFPDDAPGTRSDFVRWAEDGKTLLYTSNQRESKSMDLYELDLATRRSTLVWENTRSWELALTTRDHKAFVYLEELSDADSNLHLVRRGAAAPKLLTPHEGEVRYGPADFSPDGRTLFYTSDEGREFAAANAMDLATGTSRLILSPPWDVYGARFSRNGKVFVTSVNHDGAPELAFTDVASGKPLKLPPIPKGALVSAVFSSSGRWIAARVESDAAPRSLSLLDLKTQTARPLFDPLPPSLKDRSFAPARSIQVESFDGRMVPGLLYVPDAGEGVLTGTTHPAVIDIHGGPTSQSVRVFRPFTQYLVSKGYVVLVPNVRGSVGYGKTYTSLDNKDFGGGPLKDVLACKTWLVNNAHVDPDRVAVMGQSYGGYMTLAAATFTPTAFAAHVDLFGISDLKSLVEGFPVYWESAMAYIYRKFGNPNDSADAAYQRERSPLFFADRIQRPLLVIQGENDPRVKKDQSDRLVEAVRQRGVPVEYLVIEGEGHGFSKNENQLRAMEAVDRFLDRYLTRR